MDALMQLPLEDRRRVNAQGDVLEWKYRLNGFSIAILPKQK